MRERFALAQRQKLGWRSEGMRQGFVVVGRPARSVMACLQRKVSYGD